MTDKVGMILDGPDMPGRPREYWVEVGEPGVSPYLCGFMLYAADDEDALTKLRRIGVALSSGDVAPGFVDTSNEGYEFDGFKVVKKPDLAFLDTTIPF